MGGGFGGIADFRILERGPDVGGVWRDNTYPGAACNVPSHLYSFSFEPNPDWSRRFASQDEIHAYLRRCAAKYGLAGHLRCNAEVAEAVFDDAAGRWRCLPYRAPKRCRTRPNTGRWRPICRDCRRC